MKEVREMSRLVVGLEKEPAEMVTRSDRQAIQYTYCCQKDTFAYFCPAALMRRVRANQAINADAILPSGAMIYQITMRFPIGVGGASLNRNS